MKNLIYLLVIVALAIATWNIKGCFEKKQKAPTVQYVNPLTDTVKHYKDLYGSIHAQVQMEINNRTAMDKVHQQKIDSLLKRIHLKDKQLLDITQVVAEAHGQFQTVLQPVYIHDSTTGKDVLTSAQRFAWHDDFLSESGVVDHNSISINYSMSLPFTTTSYWKRRHHLFGIGWGKKIYYLDAFCPNKNVLITGLQAIKIN